MKKMKKTAALLLALLMLTGCSVTRRRAAEYSDYFIDAFDTFTKVIGFAESPADFDHWFGEIHDAFLRYNDLYDRFYEHEGMNNICTINRQAGKEPVAVEPEILDLLEFGKEQYVRTGGKVNVAIGAVTDIWHRYMARYQEDSTGAVLPEEAELQEAAGHCNIDDLILDREAGTVFLRDPEMLLDVGAIAKGYATQRIADELYAQGFHHFAISAGGNICVKDAPDDGKRTAWGIGITDPRDPSGNSLDVLYLTHQNLVTSGDYQRYYMVGDRRIHHLVDPDTLYPAAYYRSVTVLCPDGGRADAGSTALFLLPPEQSLALAEKEGLEALWVDADGTIRSTPGFDALCRDRGGASNTESK